jgi:hypothetical protein
MYLIDLLPGTIEFLVKYGYIQDEEVQQVKTASFQKITDPDFVSSLKKEVKHGDKIRSIKLLPIIIKEILEEGKKVNDAALAKDPNAKIYDLSDIADLSRLILKKKIEKMEKAGIPVLLSIFFLSFHIRPHWRTVSSIGFALSTIPCMKVQSL